LPEQLHIEPHSAIKSIGWLVAERVISVTLSMLVTLTIARYLAPEAFGRLSFLIALVSLAAPLMAAGLNSLVSREVLERPADSGAIVGSSLALRVGSGLVVAIVAVTASSYLLPAQELPLLAVLIFASVLSAADVVDLWLQAHVANHVAAAVRLAVLLIFSCARLAAVWDGAGVEVFVYLLAAEFVCLAVLYLVAYHRLSGGVGRLTVTSGECRGLLHQSRWLLLSGVAAVIYLKIDQVMLGVMVDDRAVGVYVAATKLSEVWYFLPAALVISFFPQLIDKRATDQAGYMTDLQRVNDALLAIGLLVAVVVTGLAGWLVPLLFGADYLEAVPVLVVHVWAAIFVFMRALLSKWLIAEHLLPLSLLSQGAGAVANVLLNLYLIPLYGPLGAAYATVVSYVLSGYIILFAHPSLRPMARVVTCSLMLPYRLMIHGRRLYQN
jgi:PST family polysaccharide transporter